MASISSQLIQICITTQTRQNFRLRRQREATFASIGLCQSEFHINLGSPVRHSLLKMSAVKLHTIREFFSFKSNLSRRMRTSIAAMQRTISWENKKNQAYFCTAFCDAPTLKYKDAVSRYSARFSSCSGNEAHKHLRMVKRDRV